MCVCVCVCLSVCNKCFINLNSWPKFYRIPLPSYFTILPTFSPSYYSPDICCFFLSPHIYAEYSSGCLPVFPPAASSAQIFTPSIEQVVPSPPNPKAQFTYVCAPTCTEGKNSRFSLKLSSAANLFCAAKASAPGIPSVEYNIRVKERLCSRQAWSYRSLLSFSDFSRAF